MPRKQSTAEALAEANAATAAAAPGERARLTPLVELPLDLLDASPDNPRHSLGPDALLDEMAASIKSMGVLEPLLVGPRDADTGRYTIIAGHRRAEAGRRAGLLLVPCIVRDDLTGEAAEEARLIENLQRLNLTPIEEAEALARLVRTRSQSEIAARLGWNQGTISKRLSLLKLPADLQGMVGTEILPVGVAVDLAKLVDNREAIGDVKKLVMQRDVTGDEVAQAVTQRLERERRRKALDKRTRELAKEGVAVVEWPKDGYWSSGNRPDRPLEGQVSRWIGSTVHTDVELHRGRPCHAVAISPATLEELAVCTDPGTHAEEQPKPQAGPGAGTVRRETRAETKARKEREAEEERRRATAVDAHERRMAVVRRLVAPGGLGRAEAADHVARWVLSGCVVDRVDRAFDLAGLPRPLPEGNTYVEYNMPEAVLVLAALEDAEPWRVALAGVLGDVEHLIAPRYQRDRGQYGYHWGTSAIVHSHFDLLRQHGYEPTAYELDQLERGRADMLDELAELLGEDDGDGETREETGGAHGTSLTAEQLAAEGKALCPTCEGVGTVPGGDLCTDCLGVGTVAAEDAERIEARGADLEDLLDEREPSPAELAAAEADENLRCPLSGKVIEVAKGKKAPKPGSKVTCPECGAAAVVTLTGKYRQHDKGVL